MSIVTLVSGGIDSALMAVLTKEENIIQHPLFINYGQLSRDREWKACQENHKNHQLPVPKEMNISGFGNLISSGLTDTNKDIHSEAFLPGRNLLFLLAGSSYAYQQNANAVSIGLLNEEVHLFPDQTQAFIQKAEDMIKCALGKSIKIIAPLMPFYKSDILKLARERGIIDTYSCHAGSLEPCGKCISCLEIISATEMR